MNDFYVYAWKINKTNHIFYVGKGTKYRYKSMKSRNSHFKSIINKNWGEIEQCQNYLLIYMELLVTS